MRLQNAEHAIIPVSKTRDYVLDEAHPQNKGKARVFTALGYSRREWAEFEAALREQHLNEDAVEIGQDAFGVRWKIEAQLRGPLGNARIRSVWMIYSGDEIPYFITAYRLRR